MTQAPESKCGGGKDRTPEGLGDRSLCCLRHHRTIKGGTLGQTNNKESFWNHHSLLGAPYYSRCWPPRLSLFRPGPGAVGGAHSQDHHWPSRPPADQDHSRGPLEGSVIHHDDRLMPTNITNNRYNSAPLPRMLWWQKYGCNPPAGPCFVFGDSRYSPRFSFDHRVSRLGRCVLAPDLGILACETANISIDLLAP